MQGNASTDLQRRNVLQHFLQSVDFNCPYIMSLYEQQQIIININNNNRRFRTY